MAPGSIKSGLEQIQEGNSQQQDGGHLIDGGVSEMQSSQDKHLRHSHHLSYHHQEFKTITSNPHIQILENGSMVIRDAELSDSAKYMCQAFNGINPSLSSIIQLDVLSPPQFDVKFETVSVKKGASIRFACAPRGDPPIRLEWKKDGRSLQGTSGLADTGTGGAESASSKYHILQRNQTNNSNSNSNNYLYGSNASSVAPSILTVGSELIMEFVDRSDSSLFTCLADNSIGQDELTYRLIVQELPDAPINIRVASITSSSIKLSWQAPFDGNSPINQYIIEYKQDRAAPSGDSSNQQEQQGTSQQQQHQKHNHNRYHHNNNNNNIDINNQVESETGYKSTGSTSEWIRINVPNRGGQQQQQQMSTSLSAELQQKSKLTTTTTMNIDDNNQLFVILRNLKAKTTYHIRLASVNSIGQGEFCPQLTVTTAEEAPSYRPAEVKAQPMSSSSIKVVWRGPIIQDYSAPIKGYYVGYRKYLKTDGLIAHQQHTIDEQTTTIGGNPSTTLPVAATTTPPLSPTTPMNNNNNNFDHRSNVSNSNIIDQDQQQLHLQQRQSGTTISNDNKLAFATVESQQQLQQQQSSSMQQPAQSNSLQSGPFHEYVINNLEKNTKYEIKVQAFNSAGTGPSSETFGQTMKFDRPGQPQLKVLNTRHNSIEIRWTISDQNPVAGKLIVCV